MAHTQMLPTACHSEGLADILERVLDKGVVIAGDIRIKLCDIELLSIQIRLLIASVDKAREMGLTWWWQQPEQQAAAAALPARQAGAGPSVARRKAPGNSTHFRSFNDNRQQAERVTPWPRCKDEPPAAPTARRRRGESRGDFGFNLGGFLGSLGSAMEKLVDLAETGQDLSHSRRDSRDSTPRASSAASTASPSRRRWATRASAS